MDFPEWRLRVVRTEFDEPQINPTLHLFSLGKAPTRLRHCARLLGKRVHDIVSRAVATRPRDVLVSPGPIGVDTSVPGELARGMGLWQALEPSLQSRLDGLVIVSMLLLEQQIFVPDLPGSRLLLSPDRLPFPSRLQRLG